MNEFGQRSVASLLLASSSSRPGAQVSLAEFLDRKSADGSSKRSKRCLHEDQKVSLAEFLDRKSTQGSSKTSLHEDEKAQPDATFPSQRVCDDLTAHRLFKKQKTHQKARVNTVQRRHVECGGRSHLLVLGDVPMQRPKLCKPQINRSHAYNHYVDGSGWWGEELVGMEEAGTACEWEGVASMSLGVSTATSP